MLIVDKEKFEQSKKRVQKQILDHSIDGVYLRNLMFKKNQIEVEGIIKEGTPYIRTDDLVMDNDSRSMHR